MWQELLLSVFRSVIGKATPEIREKLVELLDEWEKKAKATPNPWDDLLVHIVRGLVVV
jgi:hypothetical protein